MPKTPIRTMRVDDELWDAFGEVTDDKSGTIRDFIRWFVRERGATLPPRPAPSTERTEQ